MVGRVLGTEADEKKAEAEAALEREIVALRKRREAMGGVATVEKGDFQGALNEALWWGSPTFTIARCRVDAVQQFRQLWEGKGDEEWTLFNSRD